MNARVDDLKPASRFMFLSVALCFVLSGVAALIYQLVWMRYLSTVFGTSELAVVTVLVAYMGGLATGAWVASKWIHRIRRPILAYATLEAAIAASALLVPSLLTAVRRLHQSIHGGQPTPPSDGGVFEAVSFLGMGCIVLLIPTACMGATLPILIKGVIHRSEQIGRRVGHLYALNTTGAVIGTVLAAFYLIPSIGLWSTSLVGVGVNLIVAALGWLIARGAATRPGHSPSAVSETETQRAGTFGASPKVFNWVVLSVMLVSGAASFAYEVLWTRLLSHLLGGSLYAFATMLSAFLAGIAAGGLLGAKLANEKRRSALWLSAAELATGLLTVAIYCLVSSPSFVRLTAAATLWEQAGLCGTVLLSVTFCLGATFPLAVRSLTDDPAKAATWTGRVYAWNTLGAIVGALGAGYFIIPAIGYARTFQILVACNLILGCTVLLALRPVPKPSAVAAGVLTIGCLVAFHPAPPLSLLVQSPLAGKPRLAQVEPSLVHHAVGRSASVAVLRQKGAYGLRTNGLPEAEVFPKGAASLSYSTIHWMPSLPKVLRPKAESLLVVGFGGGAILEAVPSGFRSIDVIELEQEVIVANQWLANRRAVDPLKDPRLTLIINDARGALGLTQKCYDVIISQPSHPWTAGASHLYTQEFFQIARNHLNTDGLFVQWLGAHFVDEPLFRSFAKTMVDVFPHVQLYFIGGNFLFAGSETPLDADFLADADSKGSLIHLSEYPKISFVEDVLAALQLDEVGCRRLAANRPSITDEHNLMATYFFPGTENSGTLNNPTALRRVLGPIHYLNQPASELLAHFSDIDSRYFAQLIRRGSPHVDLQQFENALSETDKAVTQGMSQVERQPEAVVDLLSATDIAAATPRTAAALSSLEAQARFSLALRAWNQQERGPLPLEFQQFLATNHGLNTSFERLPKARQAVMEARYWSATRQFGRVRTVLPALASFTDHRDVWFESASHARLDALLDRTDKTAAEQANDLREAVILLDFMLSLPQVNRVPVASKRIEAAHRAQDSDYLVAFGWILIRNIGSASGGDSKTTPVFAQLLGQLLTPYGKRLPSGKVAFSNPTIASFYEEVLRQVGPGVFPKGFRPSG